MEYDIIELARRLQAENESELGVSDAHFSSAGSGFRVGDDEASLACAGKTSGGAFIFIQVKEPEGYVRKEGKKTHSSFKWFSR